MHRLLRACGIAASLCVTSWGVASAQPTGPALGAPTAPAPELDFRVGALWPQDNAARRLAAGLRVALRPWAAGPADRVSLQFTGDFRSFGGVNAFDNAFQVASRVTRNRLVVTTALGFDVFRTSRTAVDIRAGVALVRTRTNFLIDSSQGFVTDADIWENVCPFEGFKERCSTSYEGTPLVAVGLRRDLVQSGAAFVGVDYTGLGLGQHILMGTVGMRLR